MSVVSSELHWLSCFSGRFSTLLPQETLFPYLLFHCFQLCEFLKNLWAEPNANRLCKAKIVESNIKFNDLPQNDVTPPDVKSAQTGF